VEAVVWGGWVVWCPPILLVWGIGGGFFFVCVLGARRWFGLVGGVFFLIFFFFVLRWFAAGSLGGLLAVALLSLACERSCPPALSVAPLRRFFLSRRPGPLPGLGGAPLRFGGTRGHTAAPPC